MLEELNRRKAVVYVHPKVTSDMNDADDPLQALGINWENTTRTISSLLKSGMLMRLPDVKFIFSHGGGLLPTVAVRLAGKSPEKLAALRGLYLDTAQTTTNPGAWGALTAFAEPSHVLFGSDFPYVGDGLAAWINSREAKLRRRRGNRARLRRETDSTPQRVGKNAWPLV